MQPLNVTVSDGFEESLRETANAAGFDDPGAYLEALVKADRKRLAQERLAAEIRKGLDSGPGRVMTDEDWNRVREESNRRATELRTLDIPK